MGAHAFASLVRPPSTCSILFHILPILAIVYIGTPVSGVTEAEALLKFRSALTNKEAIPNWNLSTTPCSNGKWLGVICEYGVVWGLQLENMGLGGTIDIDALAQLPELKTLSIKNNKFDSPIPDFDRLPKLRSVYLTNNKFSGEIPDNAFVGMHAMRRVILSNNAFTGKIPSSLTGLPILVELKLDGNQFQGSIPNFQQKELQSVNVANNQLEGPIPAKLTKLDPKFFSGNKGLCGPPLPPCDIESTAATPNTKHKSSSLTTMIVLLLGLMILAVIFLLLCQKKCKARQAKQKLQNTLVFHDNQFVEAYPPPSEERTPATRKRSEQGKLDFVRDDRRMFDLSELLTASAEVLESGNFESSYKVEIFSGEILVVKRFRQMSKVGREDFHEHIRRMGKLRHPNVLALVAYYFRKEEKLLIFDFVDNGNLASHLHGNRNQKKGGFDWPTRLKIIKGVARGLCYLYDELPSLVVPHGYLKSSNVILNNSYEPLLTDYALQPLINPEHAKQLMVAYKSPDYAHLGHLTKKTDVWSLGILILEVLTGKFPTNFLAVGNVKDQNLIAWVNDIASEDDQGENVFDKEMKGTQHSQVEMRKLLKVGFGCCHENIDVRWSIKEAVQKIEEVKETDDLI